MWPWKTFLICSAKITLTPHMHFLHINWVESGNIFNRIVSLLNGHSEGTVGERKENASPAPPLNWFCKRWEISVDTCRRTCLETKLQSKHQVNMLQSYQRCYRCVRWEKNQQSIPNMKQLSGQEHKKWHPAEMWSQAACHKKTDDWLSGSLEDSLIITQGTQTLSVPWGAWER